MKRYVVKSENKWKVVTPKYKRASKNFTNRKDAIAHAYNIEDTTLVLAQGEDNKFSKITNEEIKGITKSRNRNLPSYIPRYVYKNAGMEKEAAQRVIYVVLIICLVIFLLLGIVFGTLYAIDKETLR